jgi:hypothetical protein
VLTATAFAADSDIVLTMGNSAGLGWAAGVARFFARVFFSVGGAGAASSSPRGVSSAMGGGFSLAASVGISTIGSEVRFFGRGVGVAFTVIAGSKSFGEAKAWARATCDAPNAILLHRIERRIPLPKHIKEFPPLSALRNPESIARFIFAPDTSSASFHLCYRYPTLTSINSSRRPPRAACECR